MVAGWQQSAVEPRGCVPRPASAMSEQHLQTGEIVATRTCFVDSQSRAEGLPRGGSPPCPSTGIFSLKKVPCSASLLSVTQQWRRAVPCELLQTNLKLAAFGFPWACVTLLQSCSLIAESFGGSWELQKESAPF